MNAVFWVIVIIFVFSLWVFLAKYFRVFGRLAEKLEERVRDGMKDNEENEVNVVYVIEDKNQEDDYVKGNEN